MVYINIRLRNIVDNFFLFSRKKALTVIAMLGIYITLFRGNSPSKLNLIFI